MMIIHFFPLLLTLLHLSSATSKSDYILVEYTTENTLCGLIVVFGLVCVCVYVCVRACATGWTDVFPPLDG